MKLSSTLVSRGREDTQGSSLVSRDREDAQARQTGELLDRLHHWRTTLMNDWLQKMIFTELVSELSGELCVWIVTTV